MVRCAVRKLFVEGGGERNPPLASECRRGFAKLLENSGFESRMPRIVACGTRRAAYDQFCIAIEGLRDGDVAVLLVDSEAPVTHDSPWDHVRNREGDRWDKPGGVTDDHLHLMVQCMEAWFLADRNAMREFFGNGFREASLPAKTAKIESQSKVALYPKLAAATKDTKTKGAYDKGGHSFKLLAQLNPSLVRKASPWAERFFSTLDAWLK